MGVREVLQEVTCWGSKRGGSLTTGHLRLGNTGLQAGYPSGNQEKDLTVPAGALSQDHFIANQDAALL